MEDSMRCGNCGIWVHCFLRTCPACGGSLFVSLENVNARPELFFDLMTSLFNLVADKDNARRGRYLPPFSEDVIQRRCELEFHNEVYSFELDVQSEEDWPEEIRDLFAMSLTNTLTGYIYRSVEEFVTQKKSPELLPAEKQSLIAVLDSPKAGIGRSCYRRLDRSNAVDRAVLFCLALRLGNTLPKYMLADDDKQKSWYFSIVEQVYDRTIHFYSMAFKAIQPLKSLNEFMNQRRDSIRDNVEKDFLFGYVVKLSESLNPVKSPEHSRLH